MRPFSEACDMKPRAKRKNCMKIKENSARSPVTRPLSSVHRRRSSVIRPPTYSLRKHIAFWSLTFDGQEACFDHEQGAYYVAYLLLNPPDKPIHGMALEIKSLAFFGEYLRCPGVTEIVDPSTGETMILACDAIFEQRNLALDDADYIQPLRCKQLELE